LLDHLLGPDVAKVDGDVARRMPNALEPPLARTERHSGFDDLWQQIGLEPPPDTTH
jgi:hypothetical protein